MRLSLPSKGRLSEDVLSFLDECGLHVHKPNPRQYEARIPTLPELVVLFQRPSDIVVSVRDGSVAFGITGIDVTEENKGNHNDVIILHDSLGFGQCKLTLAVPENWNDVTNVLDLQNKIRQLGRPIRVATKYSHLTEKYLSQRNIVHTLIYAEGALETAPAIGYADIISDLVSSGQTLRDNRLKVLQDGIILPSQAALIANRKALISDIDTLNIARQLLESIEAHLRAVDNGMITAAAYHLHSGSFGKYFIIYCIIQLSRCQYGPFPYASVLIGRFVSKTVNKDFPHRMCRLILYFYYFSFECKYVLI